MEALWSRFNPSISKVKELIDNGLIGEVKYIKKILEEELLTPKDFFIKDFQELSIEGGFRNASINNLDLTTDENLIKFQIPRGSYATIVLREILKPSNPLDCGF